MSFTALVSRWVVFAAGAWTMGCSMIGACPVDVEGAWEAYEDGSIGEAHEDFLQAVERCPASSRAKLGLGYTALRRGELELAEEMFQAAAQELPDDPDLLVGMGILRWRTGDFQASKVALERALDTSPDNVLALAYLQRFPSQAAVTVRTPFERPDSLVYPARVNGSVFEVRTTAGWEPFYVRGVNIGAATPSLYPSQFPAGETYTSWLSLIGAMGANAVRVYTIHPPDFYAALREYNFRHEDAPLWLLHGAWAEPPPGDVGFDHPGWRSGFYREVHAVVDVIHGRADLPLRSGRAAGTYTADVSPWTLGLILGRGREASSIAGYHRSASGPGSWSGRYVQVAEGSPIDVWMARAIEEAVSYETAKYNAQRPVAYANWAPTDPLHHPTESTSLEERAIRRSFGDLTEYAEEDLSGDDAVTLDPALIKASSAFPAGYFASYHVYAHYPDFMVLEPGLNEAVSPWGPSNFWGYLTALKAHHDDMPVLIAEYGLPASIGIAHQQPQGWHEGGKDERTVASIHAQLTREIRAAGMAGGVVFEWIDEWFKGAWNTTDLESPREMDRLWYNRMDAEEHYGVLAVEPVPALPGATLDERLAAWRRVPTLLQGSSGVALRATTDEAYVWLLVEYGGFGGNVEETLIGFDVLDPEAGDFRWPEAIGSGLPVGLEFVLRASEDEARMTVDSSYYALPLEDLGFSPPDAPLSWPMIQDPPPAMFRGRLQQEPSRALRPRRNEDGAYQGMGVLTNRARFGRDSTEYAAIGYDWGVLPGGAPPDGLWERGAGVLEVRIPWQLLNVADPSQRRALAYDGIPESGELGTETIDGIRLLLAFRSGAELRSWPAPDGASDVPLLTWDTWTTPRWTTRLRPTYWLVRDAWAEQEPSVIVSRSDP